MKIKPKGLARCNFAFCERTKQTVSPSLGSMLQLTVTDNTALFWSRMLFKVRTCQIRLKKLSGVPVYSWELWHCDDTILQPVTVVTVSVFDWSTLVWWDKEHLLPLRPFLEENHGEQARWSLFLLRRCHLPTCWDGVAEGCKVTTFQCCVCVCVSACVCECFSAVGSCCIRNIWLCINENQYSEYWSYSPAAKSASLKHFLKCQMYWSESLWAFWSISTCLTAVTGNHCCSYYHCYYNAD